jgi:hypothetical protein
VGTLKSVASPFVQTIAKVHSQNRAIAMQRAKKATIEMLEKLGAKEITAARRLNPSERVPMFDRSPEGFDKLELYEDGKRAAYHVDRYIAKAFGVYTSADLMFATRILQDAFGQISWANRNIFRPLIITYNLSFGAYANPIRDLTSTWKFLGAKHGVSLKSVLVEYFRAMPAAVRRFRGIEDNVIREMMDSAALDSTMADLILKPEDDHYDAFMVRSGLIQRDAKPTSKFLSGLISFGEALRFVSDVCETSSKVAGYQIEKREMMKELQATIDSLPAGDPDARIMEQDIKDLEAGKGRYAHKLAFNVRNFVGTPNFRKQGIFGQTSNTIFMFMNVTKEGMKRDLQIATQPSTRAGYLYRTTLVNVMPTILRYLAMAGLFGEALKEFFQKFSEYYNKSYNIIPLGMTEDGKAIGIVVPMDEGGRIASHITWQIMKILDGKPFGLNDFGNIFGQVLPSWAPPLDIAWSWGSYMAGRNPYDTFRGTNILPKDAEKVRGLYGLKRMMMWTIDKTGLTNLSSYDPAGLTWGQWALRTTPLINRAIKVTDYGEVEQRKQERQAHEMEDAERRLKRGGDARRFSYEMNTIRSDQHMGLNDKEDRKKLARLKAFAPAFRAYDQAIRKAEAAGMMDKADEYRRKQDAMAKRALDSIR